MGSRKRPKPNPKAEPLQQSRPEASETTNKEAEASKTQDLAVSTVKLGDSEIDSGAEIKATTVRMRGRRLPILLEYIYTNYI